MKATTKRDLGILAAGLLGAAAVWGGVALLAKKPTPTTTTTTAISAAGEPLSITSATLRAGT